MLLDLDDIAEVVADAVKAATAPLIAENAALSERLAIVEARKMPETVKGDPGEVDMAAVRSILEDLVRAAFATIPPPRDGKSIDPDEVRQMVEEAVAALPPAKDGESVDMDVVSDLIDKAALRVVGEKALELVALIPVPDAPEPVAPDMAAIEASIRDGIAKAVAELPVAKDGVDGENGIGLADALIDKNGHLVITMTDGRTKALGLVVGKDGVSPDALAPFKLDDFDIEQTDERTFTFKFTHGGEMHSFEFEFPVAIYRGVWTEKEYQRGDMVTWAGSVWHADKATSAKPDTPDSGWKLAVKRGRDGRDAKP